MNTSHSQYSCMFNILYAVASNESGGALATSTKRCNILHVEHDADRANKCAIDNTIIAIS